MKTRIFHLSDGPRKEQAPREAEVRPSLEYSEPKIVKLGEAGELVQGYWNEGWADYGDHYKHSNE
jgi:hypothetical protein